MSKKHVITLCLLACLILLGACNDKAGSGEQEKQATMQTAVQAKEPLLINGYSAMKPDKDASKLSDHYSDQEKKEIPHHEAGGGDPERTVPLGDVLLKGKEDNTNGPLKDNRLVAFYGTPLSENMGILGRYSPDEMMKKLKEKTQEYSNLDPERPAIPTIELIATVAQRSPGPQGLYITPPNDDVIREYIQLAQEEEALLLLDIQLGRASVMEAVKKIEPYLKEPNVHLAIDTEYSVGEGQIPGKDLGQVDGANIQKAVDYVDQMVQENNLSDKMVLVHQFGNGIIQNKDKIHATDHVEVPLNYDGFGDAAIKKSAYGRLVREQPIQYGGFKLFTKNDTPLMTPKQVLALEPAPAIVNYQ
ncbi:hypothetical protein [Lentibacillus kapialis]|nr:hypothetical protein [Lentibacillus kapialis]